MCGPKLLAFCQGHRYLILEHECELVLSVINLEANLDMLVKARAAQRAALVQMQGPC